MSLDLRLSLPVAFAWLVTILLVSAPQLGLASTIVLWLAAGGATAAALLSRRPALASIALACTLGALCSTSVTVQAEGRQPASLNELSSHHTQVEVWGTTTSAVRAGDEYFQAELSAVVIDDEVIVLSSPALVFRDRDRFSSNPPDPLQPHQEWGIGVKFSLAATLTATEPGDGRAVLVFASEDPVWRADPAESIEWANQLRRTFAALEN